MSPTSTRDQERALAAALLPIIEPALRAAGADDAHGAALRASERGALGVLPAVLALRHLRSAIEGPWDGLVHRRCSQRLLGEAELLGQAQRRDRPAQRPARGAAGAGRGGPGAPLLSATRRAGWELIGAQMRIEADGRTWWVLHELARRLPPTGAPSPGAGPPRPARRPRPPGRAATDRRGAEGGAIALRLTPRDLRAWAGASGDGNELHLRPGAPARAGIAVGSREVIAHGLLLGALSLALVPPAQHRAGRDAPGQCRTPRGPADGAPADAPGPPGAGRGAGRPVGPALEHTLRFPSPLAIPAEEHGRCLIRQDGNCESGEGSLVLIRGSIE